MFLEKVTSKRTSRWGAMLAVATLAFSGCADIDAETDGLSGDELAQEAQVDKGVGNGRDVVTIGDSWMSNTLFTGDAIEGALRRAGKRYRNYGVQGVMLLEDGLFGAAIPTQFEAAVRQNRNIKTVIMTGGGNDVLLVPGAQQECQRQGPACQKKLAEIGAGLKKLWERMAAAGVEDVVYIGYSENAGSAGANASNVNKNGVAEICANAPVRCHSFDSTPLVPRNALAIDGIHPVRGANDKIAKAILQLLEEKGIRR